MPTEVSLELFWDLLQRSGVISEEELEPLRSEYAKDLVHLDTAAKVSDDLVARNLLTRWQAEMLLQGRHKGFFLGPYRLLGLLGKGGMGSVYLAEHQLIRRRTAVKVLPSKAISRRPSMKERFRREAQAVASLDHPNIVRAYDFSKELLDKTEVFYLAMEFVEGKDLQELIRNEGTLDYVCAVDYIRQAALGLAHAHAAGLVHRDIKPANLLIDKKGVVKLLDLGLVKSFDDSEEASLTGEHENTVLGTADYLAPEQAVSSRDVDSRADIYSLGYTLYFSLCGHPPFPEGTIHQRMAAHQSRHAPPVTEHRPDCPQELIEIIKKMVAKHPVDRFHSADELAEVLSNWLFEHADEDWILGHPGLHTDGTEPRTHVARETAPSGPSMVNETELDLAPIEEDGPISTEKNQNDSPHATVLDNEDQNDQEDSDQPGQSSRTSDTALPSVEEERLDQLLKSEPVTAGPQLRPMERLPSFWSISGIAMRLGIPPAAAVLALFVMFMIIIVILAIFFFSRDSETAVGNTASSLATVFDLVFVWCQQQPRL